ncbi:hypothetical protein EUTSA_v10023748mg [Eutrema salsugineum]|uniref:Uncharacterized protein n=1 Tax=Eutrema salsugineum TaxID=72664 RepID=V4KGP8_EUTSA|nr:hypothetical protein EUTSA_v10023748mg [Eutrema salsugineum]
MSSTTPPQSQTKKQIRKEEKGKEVVHKGFYHKRYKARCQISTKAITQIMSPRQFVASQFCSSSSTLLELVSSASAKRSSHSSISLHPDSSLRDLIILHRHLGLISQYHPLHWLTSLAVRKRRDLAKHTEEIDVPYYCSVMTIVA